MGAADHRGVLVLEGPRLHRREQGVQVPADEVEGVAHQHRERRVHHVGRGQAVVQPAAFGAHVLGHVRHEGDDVVLHFLLDGVDAGDLEAGLLADRGQGLPRHDALLGQDLGGGDLDLQPGPEPAVVGPEARHLRARIAWDHRRGEVITGDRE